MANDTGPEAIDVLIEQRDKAITLGETLADRVEALIAAARAEGMQSTMAAAWLPIETAPKDGSRMLIWGTIESSPMARKHIGCDDMYLAYFANDCWPAEWLDGYVIEPTHWMPLPPPPAAKE